MNTNSAQSYSHEMFGSETNLSAKHAHFDGKSYFVKQRESHSYVHMTVSNDKLYLIELLFSISKQSFSKLPGQLIPMTGVISGVTTPKDKAK